MFTRVLVATTTLAQGVNMPAEAVIIVELDHPLGGRETSPYTVAEYKNIAGRAGRLGLAKQGRAITLVRGTLDGQRIWDHYVTGRPETVRSQLAGEAADLYTLVLRVIAVATPAGESGGGLSDDDLIVFLGRSLAAHQARMAGIGDAFDRPRVAAALSRLRAAGFVSSAGPVTTTQLGALVAQGGITVESALRVASILHSVQPGELNRATLIAAAQVTMELDDVHMPLHGRGNPKEAQTFLTELGRQRAAAVAVHALGAASDFRLATRRAKKAVACLLWMGGVPMGQIETLLRQHAAISDPAGPAQSAASRTRDVIGTIIDMARLDQPKAELEGLATILPVQLELGVPAEIVPIAALAGTSLRRADYLALCKAGLYEPVAITKADDEQLLSCLGGDASRLRPLREAASLAVEDTGIGFADVLPVSLD